MRVGARAPTPSQAHARKIQSISTIKACRGLAKVLQTPASRWQPTDPTAPLHKALCHVVCDRLGQARVGSLRYHYLAKALKVDSPPLVGAS